MAEIELIETPIPRAGLPRRVPIVAGRSLSLGRDGPFYIADPSVHHMHGKIVLEHEDHPAQVQATEGPVATFLNRKRVYLAWLVDGDELSVGKTRYRIHSDYARECPVCRTAMRSRAARGRARGPVFPCEGCLTITDAGGAVVATGAVVHRMLSRLEEASSTGRLDEEIRRIKADHDLGWLLWTERVARAAGID